MSELKVSQPRTQNHPATRHVSGERGAALILVVMLMSLLVFVIVGMKIASESFRETKTQLNFVAQAENAARAGLQSAESWFKRQTGGVPPAAATPLYPDAAFTGFSNNDSMDPAAGLVWEFDLQKGLKARYEVRRQLDPDSSNTISPAEYMREAAHDLSLKRGYPADKRGMAWGIQSIGIVYQDKASDPLFVEGQDRVVARSRMTAEFRKLSLNFPFPVGSALTMRNAGGGNLSLANASCRVIGRQRPGLVRAAGNPNPATTSRISGTPAIELPIPAANDFSIPTLFSVPNEKELSLLADEIIQSTTVLAASTLDGFTFVDAVRMGGTVTFNAARPMSGAGLLFVNGNATVSAGSASSFNGIVVVMGNLTMTGPATISGAALVRNNVSLSFAVEGVEILFDQDMVDRVRSNLLQYRAQKSSFHVRPAQEN